MSRLFSRQNLVTGLFLLALMAVVVLHTGSPLNARAVPAPTNTEAANHELVLEASMVDNYLAAAAGHPRTCTARCLNGAAIDSVQFAALRCGILDDLAPTASELKDLRTALVNACASIAEIPGALHTVSSRPDNRTAAVPGPEPDQSLIKDRAASVDAGLERALSTSLQKLSAGAAR